MPWGSPTYQGGVTWHDDPTTPVDQGLLNQQENALVSYAQEVGQSVVDYFESGSTTMVSVGSPQSSATQDNVLMFRYDGTVAWIRLSMMSAPAWNVLPTNPSHTNTVQMNAAIAQATQNGAQGPGGNHASGTIDIPSGTYTFDGALLWKLGVRVNTSGRGSVTFKADATAPLANFKTGTGQGGGPRIAADGNIVPALIRWDGGDQWAHWVHIKGIEFVVNTVPGLSAMWFQATGESSIFDDIACSNTVALSRTVQNAQLVAGSNSVTLTQRPTLISSTSANAATSSAINTTGATLLVLTIGGSGTPTVTDNQGNAWTVTGSSLTWIAYAWQKTGGGALQTNAAHTVTVSGTSLPSIWFASYSGTRTTSDPKDKNTTTTGSGNTIAPGSEQPSQSYDLFVTIAGGNSGFLTATIDSGFSVVNSSDLVGGVHYANWTATNLDTTSSALNPTWTTGTAPGSAVAMVSFAPAPVADFFTQDDVNAVISMGLVGTAPNQVPIAAPATPTVALAAGGSLAVGTQVSVAVRYQTANGEGPVSNLANITPTTGNQTVTVTSPPALSGATGYVVYMSTGGALLRQSGVVAIGTNYSQSTVWAQLNAAGSILTPNPYDKIDRIDWPINSTAATCQTMIMRSPAVATLNNVAITIARPTAAFIFDGGGVAGQIGSINGVNNSGPLLWLKNTAGAFYIRELSGDDNIGGMLRMSLFSGADPGYVHIGMIKSESDTYNQPWEYSMDPVILFDRCAPFGFRIDGASIVGGAYVRDVVRSDNPIGNWDYYGSSNLTPFQGGPNVDLGGIEGQNWYNTCYNNIWHDTLTGEVVPVSDQINSNSSTFGANDAYPNTLVNKKLILAGSSQLRAQGATGRAMLQNRIIGNDTNPAFQITIGGLHQWGPGGQSSLDTNLYRRSGGGLATDGVFSVHENTANEVLLGFDPVPFNNGPAICFTNNFDTTIRRLVANIVQIDNSIQLRKGNATYGTTVTPDCALGLWQTITVTNATAFTIANPLNPPDVNHTAELVIEVFNNSGGTMGTITWGAAFKLAGQVLTLPANGLRSYMKFQWNGSNWIFQNMSTTTY